MAFRQSENLIFSQDLLDALLGALSAAPADPLIDAAKVILWQNDIVPTPATVIGDLVVCDFNGYPSGGINLPALSVPLQLGLGARGVLGSVTFIAGSGLVSPGQNAFGYAVVTTAGDAIYAVERFADPVGFATPGDFVNLDVILPEPAYRSALE